MNKKALILSVFFIIVMCFFAVLHHTMVTTEPFIIAYKDSNWSLFDMSYTFYSYEGHLVHVNQTIFELYEIGDYYPN